MSTLVTYFTATGTTAAVAKKLAAVLSADIYEIVPKVPYSAADLDWHNPKSRSSVEMRDLSSRPALRDNMPLLDKYDTICVGFPIWWYTAPRLVQTFLEAGDFSQKIVFPFATSGSSGIGDTCAHLLPSCRGAKLLPGVRFEASASEEQIARIVTQAGLAIE